MRVLRVLWSRVCKLVCRFSVVHIGFSKCMYAATCVKQHCVDVFVCSFVVARNLMPAAYSCGSIRWVNCRRHVWRTMCLCACAYVPVHVFVCECMHALMRLCMRALCASAYVCECMCECFCECFGACFCECMCVLLWLLL